MNPIRETIRRHVAAFAVVAAAFCAAPGMAQHFVMLHDVLEPIRAAENVPAIAAAVMRGDKLIASGAVGVMEAGKDHPVTVASRFHIGSCTKAMTATLIGQLIHSDEFTFSSTVIDILPDLEPIIDPKCATITIRQLLTHTAGMPDYRHPSEAETALLASLTGTPVEQRRQFLEKVLAVPPVQEPGTSMDYSNAGYAIVAALAEAKTGVPWETMMERRVFAPLGMTAAGFGWPRNAQHPNEPLGHWWRDGAAVPQSADDDYDLGPVFGPAGDVNCTIGELGRFAGFHLVGLQGRNALWMDASIVGALHQPLLHDYSCGWVKREVGGRTVEWHNGSAGTFFTWMTLDVQRNIAVVVMINRGDSEHVCQLVTEKLFEEFAASTGPSPAPTPKKAPAATPPRQDSNAIPRDAVSSLP